MKSGGNETNRRVWKDRGGITRAAGILLALVAVMLVVVSIPVWRAYKYHADELGCAASLKTARDSLAIEVITENEALTTKTSRETLARTMPARDQYCPAGGTVYMLPQESGTYDLICGLHASDHKLRTRLNAANVLEQVDDALYLAALRGQPVPDTVTVELNGQELVCQRVTEEVPIRRGTGTTKGYDGIVAFFAAAGTDGWPADGVEEGQAAYFLFADEDYCAKWSAAGGWGGDSYS